MTMTRSTLALLFGALAMPAFAQTIYSCTDASGGKVYSTSRDFGNCKAVPKGPESTLPAPPPAPRSHGASANPTPSSFPKVQEDTQKARDGDRRHILEQELSGEQRHLEQAKKELAEQEAQHASSDRVAPYRDRVGQHERNIRAIQKELGNLK